MTASIDGSNNFHSNDEVDASYSPSLGAILSRTFGDYGAVYVEPMWVNNVNPFPKALADHNDTFMIGVGGRVRIRPTVYLVAEVIPRAAGYKPGSNQAGFAIEKRAGGHTFQLNFSNAFGTTRGTECGWRLRQRQLVHGLQHLAQVLLTSVHSPGRRWGRPRRA